MCESKVEISEDVLKDSYLEKRVGLESKSVDKFYGVLLMDPESESLFVRRDRTKLWEHAGDVPIYSGDLLELPSLSENNNIYSSYVVL